METFFIKILEIFNTRADMPKSYGPFHLAFFIASIAAGILLCYLPKANKEKNVKNIVLVTSIIVFILEIYKQINFSFSYTEDSVSFDFLLYSFPFQFCSMPMYVGLLAGIFRKGKFNASLLAFLATYSLFGGICVMFYPVQVFITTVGINIQTMICHGSMITLGIYLYGSGAVKLEHKTILRAMPVFASAMLIAIAANEIVYKVGVPENDAFNMFYISRHYDSNIPVYSMVHAALPYPLALLVYFTVFSLAGYVMLLGAMGISKFFKKAKKK